MKTKIPKCKTCKESLTPLTGVGWIHPPVPVNKCRENDGIVIQTKYREIYNEKYGIPKYSFEDIYLGLQKVIKENTLYKEEVKEWKQKNQELQESLRKKQLMQKLKKVLKTILSYVKK